MVGRVRRRGAAAADHDGAGEADLQIAASRILQAEAQLGISRADRTPPSMARRQSGNPASVGTGDQWRRP
jgi:outer membrane protein TolC